MNKIEKFGVIFPTPGGDIVIPCAATQHHNVFMLLQPLSELDMYPGDRIHVKFVESVDNPELSMVLFDGIEALATFTYACSKCGVVSVYLRFMDNCPHCGHNEPSFVSVCKYVTEEQYISIKSL